MQTSSVSKRRQRAVQAYAVLCALTGMSGLALSLWAHPLETASRLQQASVQYEAQSQLADLTPENRVYLRGVAQELKQQASQIVPVDAPSDTDFRGVHLKAGAL